MIQSRPISEGDHKENLLISLTRFNDKAIQMERGLFRNKDDDFDYVIIKDIHEQVTKRIKIDYKQPLS